MSLQDYNSGLPARTTPRAGGNSALSAGVGASFSVVSIQGKTFRIKQGKEETKLLDKRGNPLPELPVVIVDASPNVSRAYYAGGFSAAGGPPTCSSADGKRPDAYVEHPASSSCASCPFAVRDRVTPSGAKVSKCQNHRRIAVVPVSDLANESLGGPMLMRVPGGSLINLANYAGSLDRKNFDFWEVETVLQFDPSVAHPKLIFSPERVLDASEQAIIDDLRRGDAVRAVLALGEAEEHGRTVAPAPAPARGFDAIPARAEKRVDPREAAPAPVKERLVNVRGHGDPTPAPYPARDGSLPVGAPINVEVSEAPRTRRTRTAKPTIADAVSAPIVVEPVEASAADFEKSLDARLKGLL